MRHTGFLIPVPLAGCLLLVAAHAAEIHSNGAGGGNWSDPATWVGSRIPNPSDPVVIAMRDKVTFDLPGLDTPSCATLQIDPEGVLTYRRLPGRLSLIVTGSIRSYGTIKLEATTPDAGILELRLDPPTGTVAEIILYEQAGLLAYGRETTGSNAPNILLTAPDPAEGNPAQQSVVRAEGRVQIDIQNAYSRGLAWMISGVDNTGNDPLQRLNFINTRFEGWSRLVLRKCDTTTIRRNTFRSLQDKPGFDAIYLIACSLTQLRDNTIIGPYLNGIRAESDTDGAAEGNEILACTQGINWSGKQAMLKRNQVRQCDTGILMVDASGVLEACKVESCSTAGYRLVNLSLQMTDCGLGAMPTSAVPAKLENASVTMLNCGIADDQVNCSGKPRLPDFVETMMYVVVKLSGKIPPEAEVHMQTAPVSGGVPAGKADLNVRNSPVRTNADGWTPLPASMRALTVRSWRIGSDGKVARPPFYDLMVREVTTDPAKPGRILKQELAEPRDQWFRPTPNTREATVEITLP